MDGLPRVDDASWRSRAPALAERTEALMDRLLVASADLRALGDEASWMARETQDALGLAVALLVEERSSPPGRPRAAGLRLATPPPPGGR